MRTIFPHSTVIVTIWMLFLGTQDSGSPKEHVTPVCSALVGVKTGSHRKITVSGIYASGVEDFTLYDPQCLKSETPTWVEFRLRSQKHQKDLNQLISQSGKANVEFEGEFYGPPVPDPALPEPIRQGIQFGWGHLGAYRTKLVVYFIKRVSPIQGSLTGQHESGAELRR
jgi:hypothetical protein